jgi:PhzF family phenazine biosynthesis protein
MLPVEITKTDSSEILVTMLQSTPKRCSDPLDFDSDFSKSFSNTYLNNSLPIEIWSTGLMDILLPINSRSDLNNMSVDFNALKKLSERFEVVGVHAFAIEDSQIYARNFAPLYGIDEESATGTSNGALIAYLNHHVKGDLYHEAMILQGETMGNLSKIYAKYHIAENNKVCIWVGGNATLDTLKPL